MTKPQTTYISVNPAKNETIEEHRTHTETELQEIVADSWSAYQNWRQTSLQDRLKLVAALKSLVIDNTEELARTASLEMGKLLTEARMEVGRLTGFCDVALQEAERLLAPRSITTTGKNATAVFDPLGIILSVTPWNAPLATPFRNILPAVVTGNSVVLKPAPNVTQCAKLIVDLFEKSGFPKNLVRLVLLENSLAEKLVADPRIRKVAFTGSAVVGARLASISGSNIKPIVLELGGSDPCLVLDGSDIEKIALDLAASRCSNAGQVCCSPKRFIVDKKILKRFEEAFSSAMAKHLPGDPFAPSSQLGPMARRDLREKLVSQVEKLKANGAVTLVEGGEVGNDPGYFFKPVVMKEEKTKALSHDEELFGPVGIIIPADNLDDAIDVANATRYGLGATVYSDDPVSIETATKRLEAGFVHVNMPPRLHPDVPFGGIKASGFGRDCGEAGFFEYCNYKAVIGCMPSFRVEFP